MGPEKKMEDGRRVEDDGRKGWWGERNGVKRWKYDGRRGKKIWRKMEEG